MASILNLVLSLLVLGLLAYWSLGIKQRLRRMEKAQDDLLGHVWNTALLMRLIPMGSFPPPATGWAASSDLLVELVRRIRTARPALVVELGSGLSSLAIAAALKEAGHGRLVSVDHDEEYAEKTRALLDSAGLGTWAEIRVSPLREHASEGKTAPWYDESAFDDLHDIGVVFVDGPPSPILAAIRAPALPFFWPRLTRNGQMVLDDAERPAENAMVKAWASAHPDATVEWLPLKKGCAILHKSP